MNRMERAFALVGAVYGLMAVVAGAFAAHALRDRIEPRMLEIFEMSARYQMAHALTLLVLGLSARRLAEKWTRAAGLCFTVGIVVFSGSLYALALSGNSRVGMITPFGGVLLVLGWLAFVAAAAMAPKEKGAPRL